VAARTSAQFARHDRDRHADRPHGAQEPHRTRIHLDAVLMNLLQYQPILPFTECVHGQRVRRVGRATLGQVDAAGLQETASAVQARAAVDVGVVVGDRVERHERLVVGLRPLVQELVEHVPPRDVVHLRGVGQHAVQVEQARHDARRQVRRAGIAIVVGSVALGHARPSRISGLGAPQVCGLPYTRRPTGAPLRPRDRQSGHRPHTATKRLTQRNSLDRSNTEAADKG
jgi:hypothetical protein